MAAPSSRCNRLKMSLTGPAFNLQTVEEHTENNTDTFVSAAAVEKMSDILDFLCLGSWKDAANVELLRERNVTHVLNVAKEVPTAEDHLNLNATDFVHNLIPMLDSHAEDITQHFDKAFHFIEEARKANGKVLVHCRRGISRSPAVVVGYIMRYQKESYPDALSFVKSRRSCVSLNLAFREVLEAYQPECTPIVAHAPTACTVLNEKEDTNNNDNGVEENASPRSAQSLEAAEQEEEEQKENGAKAKPAAKGFAEEDDEEPEKDEEDGTTKKAGGWGGDSDDEDEPKKTSFSEKPSF